MVYIIYITMVYIIYITMVYYIYHDGLYYIYNVSVSTMVDDGLYSRLIFPLSNGVYCMSLRLSIAKQLAQDPSGGCRLFPGTA